MTSITGIIQLAICIWLLLNYFSTLWQFQRYCNSMPASTESAKLSWSLLVRWLHSSQPPLSITIGSPYLHTLLACITEIHSPDVSPEVAGNYKGRVKKALPILGRPR